jgi:NAD(P)-dependent dehydrogenase (short-subunit alcohol dehydrogenase family)
VVVVTGASAGVGRATVRALARQGSRIGLLARGIEGLEGAAQEVESLGGEALILPTDVADAEAVEWAAGEVESRFGPIDVWINNAMTSVFSPIHLMTADEVRRVTEVTYLGAVHGTLAALKRMRPRDHGVIVQVGSALAHRAIPLQAAYCAAKHAIEGFSESLRCELLHDGSRVQVTMVQLPALNTPQHGWVKSRLPREAQPVPPIYQPELAARAILWSIAHPRREVWVGMPTWIVLLGNKLFPGLGDWYLARTGYDSQMTDEPRDPDRPHNLWKPVPGDHGAHGRFDERAWSTSLPLWLREHRGAVALAVLAGIGLACVTARSRTHHHL